jgi:hypothetical protein
MKRKLIWIPVSNEWQYDTGAAVVIGETVLRIKGKRPGELGLRRCWWRTMYLRVWRWIQGPPMRVVP